MKVKFKNINPGMYLAKVTHIQEEQGPYGRYLRFSFTVTQGDLEEWSFYGTVKPSRFKQAKFYRWMVILLQEEPRDDFSLYDLIGKECRIHLQRRKKGDKTYYSVQDLVHGEPKENSPLPLH